MLPLGKVRLSLEMPEAGMVSLNIELKGEKIVAPGVKGLDDPKEFPLVGCVIFLSVAK